MNMPEGTPPRLWQCIEKCWAALPADRPSFSDLAYDLTNMSRRADGTEIRDIGELLTNPEIEKEAKKRADLQNKERHAAAEVAKRKREELAADTELHRHIWLQLNLTKKDAEKLVLSNPEGSYVVREERPNEKLSLVVNEHGSATHFVIRYYPKPSACPRFKCLSRNSER